MRLPRRGPLAALLVALPLGALALAAALLAAPPPQSPAPAPAEPEPQPEPQPGGALVYAALGDSITRAAGAEGLGESPRLSWATGDDEDVRSLALRLERALAPRGVEALNLAASGARAEDLPRQARLAAQAGAGVVTVLVGANDACAPGPLDVARLRASVREALDALPDDATVLVLATPRVGALLDLWGADPGARATWQAFGTCPGVLAPGPHAEGRVAAVNAALEEEARRAGATWVGATAEAEVAREHVSTWDFFHPSAAGQRRLAELAWRHVEPALAARASS